MRKVKLVLGPYDGAITRASGDVLLKDGLEIYVYDGGSDPDRFIHAVTFLRNLPRAQRRVELRIVGQWLQYLDALEVETQDLLVTLPQTLPHWRLQAWIQLFRLGQLGMLRGSFVTM